MVDKERAILDMVLVQRREWDPTEPDRSPLRSWNDITGVEVHYTGAPGPKSLVFADKKQWLLSIERYHEQTKGWSDIFYNLFIFADGEVWLGRNPLVQSQGSLFNWLTVHVPGTTGMELTNIQKTKLAKMADALGGLRGHGERAATSCPGASALDFIHAYRDGSFQASLTSMNRGEFAVKMLGSVQAMIDAGITTQTLQTYNASQVITRSEAATMFVRYAGETVSSLQEGLTKAVGMGFYESVGDGSAPFQKVWFDSVFAKVNNYLSEKASVEAARVAAAEQAAVEAAQVEADRLAAEEAARVAAEEAARLAAAAVAAAEAERVAEEAALAEYARLQAEQAAAVAAAAEAARVAAEQAAAVVDTEIPDAADPACCDPIDDSEVGGLLRKILEWVFSIFSKRQ
jgi:hypothetical protein